MLLILLLLFRLLILLLLLIVMLLVLLLAPLVFLFAVVVLTCPPIEKIWVTTSFCIFSGQGPRSQGVPGRALIRTRRTNAQSTRQSSCVQHGFYGWLGSAGLNFGINRIREDTIVRV